MSATPVDRRQSARAVFCSIAATAGLITLLAPSAASAAPPSADFLERWRDAERRLQVLDLQGYNDRMAALAPEAGGLDVREHAFFHLSAARAACFAGNPAYSTYASAGLERLTEDVANDDGSELRALWRGLGTYNLGSASLVYEFFGGRHTDGTIGLREAQWWRGTLVSYFGTQRFSGSAVGWAGERQRTRGTIAGLDLQSQDGSDVDESYRPGEDYEALQLTYCAGFRNQAVLVLPDLPLRLAPRTRVAGQAFGLKPSTKVRVTWKPCPRGAVYRLSSCDMKRARRQRMGRTIRRTLAIGGTTFTIAAPRRQGRWYLTVKPIRQTAGSTRRRYSGETSAMVTVKPGGTVFRRDFRSLPD